MSLGILKSEELKRAAERALSGEPDRFLKMLVFHSGLPGPRPNLRLAEVVGEALAGEPASGPIVARMAEEIAAPDTAEVFLPIVAAHALAASVQRGRANDAAWLGLRELAGDERAPVRQGTEHALLLLGKRGHADALVRQLGGWLAHERRDVRWGAAATVLDALASARAMEGLGERQTLLDTLGWLIADVVDAPRAAERSDGRRRVLAAIAAIAAAVATTFRSQPDGAAWLKEQMATARHPDLRRAFDEALERMKRHGGAEKVATLTELGEALASSAKPDRHAARRQEGMTSRGKRRKLRGR